MEAIARAGAARRPARRVDRHGPDAADAGVDDRLDVGRRAARKLRDAGIAPPGSVRPRWRPARSPSGSAVRRSPARCAGPTDTQEIARFGSTACKALRRCNDCREPFDEFKAI